MKDSSILLIQIIFILIIVDAVWSLTKLKKETNQQNLGWLNINFTIIMLLVKLIVILATLSYLPLN